MSISGALSASSSIGASSSSASLGQSVLGSGESTVDQDIIGEGYSVHNSISSSGLPSASSSSSVSTGKDAPFYHPTATI